MRFAIPQLREWLFTELKWLPLWVQNVNRQLWRTDLSRFWESLWLAGQQLNHHMLDRPLPNSDQSWRRRAWCRRNWWMSGDEWWERHQASSFQAKTFRQDPSRETSQEAFRHWPSLTWIYINSFQKQYKIRRSPHSRLIYFPHEEVKAWRANVNSKSKHC